LLSEGRDLYDNLVTGTGAHAEGLMVVISTMSADPEHVMSELVRHGQNKLEGLIDAPTFLPVIFAAPADADPWSEKPGYLNASSRAHLHAGRRSIYRESRPCP
jgi:phage terminase large subunit-like protein